VSGRWRRLPMMRCGAEVFASLRGSRGGRRATRWSSGAHRVVARHEGGGCGGALRQLWCSGGRPWLREGKVGDKCSVAPRAEAEKKLGKEMLGAHQLKGGGGVSGTTCHEGGRGRPTVGPGCGGAGSGGTRLGKIGGCPVSWLLWASSGRKGNGPREKEKKLAQPRMNHADFNLNQISKLV
jgi:hypothetical protein